MSSSGLNNSLGDIISRTNEYLETGVDRYGQPIPADMLDYVGRISDDEEDSRQTEEQIKQLLANIAADEELSDEDRDLVNELKALKCSLLKHQRIALKWMKGMEMDGQKKGGILADDMGLGKTISTLALLLSRPAEYSDFSKNARRVKVKHPPHLGTIASAILTSFQTTLVVAPVALLKQWEREIKTKVKSEHGFNVFNAHAKKENYETLSRYDVVLTSYGKIASEVKKFDEYMAKINRDDVEVDHKALTKICPFLSPKSIFYRVVLDEAQFVKNKNTKMAQAACRLQAEYRWCLSGTPMMNSVDELASLIHFLRIKPYENFKRFSKASPAPFRPAPSVLTFRRSSTVFLLGVLLMVTTGIKL